MSAIPSPCSCPARTAALGLRRDRATRAPRPTFITPKGLKEIASYAQGIGPTLDLIIPKDSAGRLTEPTTLVRDAHRAGLILHPYTMRNESPFLPADLREGSDLDAYGDVFGAFRTYFATGIDGVFTDHSGHGPAGPRGLRCNN